MAGCGCASIDILLLELGDFCCRQKFDLKAENAGVNAS
jgi:hypothetical protein